MVTISGKFKDGKPFSARLDEVGSIETAPTVLADELKQAGLKLEDVTELHIRLKPRGKQSRLQVKDAKPKQPKPKKASK
ncbi:MAG: hypothetical protein ACREA0_13905 [bacterium]